MAGSSPRHAVAVADGGQDAPSPPDALSTLKMHDTEAALETSDGHGMEDSLQSGDEQDLEDSLGKTQSPNSTEANNLEEGHDVGKAMGAVLDTSELLEMILLYLSTKDLTRALTVSKYWQKSILGSVTLKRILFLEAAPKKEFLRMVLDEDRNWVSSLLDKPEKNCKVITEPHPMLAPYINRYEPTGTYLSIAAVPCDTLRTVHPSAFLFQPPLKNIEMAYLKLSAHCEHWGRGRYPGGATFGDLLKKVDALRIQSEEHGELSSASSWDYDSDYSVEMITPAQAHVAAQRAAGVEEIYSVDANRAIATSADLVKTAREARAKEQSSADRKEPDTNQGV